MKYQDPINRLLARHDLIGDCWVYTGAKNPAGYGKMSYFGTTTDVHRIAYFEFIGEIPADMIICHTCDNPSCFNPSHLFLGTQLDNIRDMHMKRRHAHGESLSKSIKAGWTRELRTKRSAQVRERNTKIKAEKTKRAGVPADWKFCPKCTDWKPLSGYYKNKARHDGVKPYCKPCS